MFIFVRDTLHAVDFGVSQAISGSVLWFLAFGGYVNADPGDSIRIVLSLLSDLCSVSGSRSTNLELDPFTDSDRPRSAPPWLMGGGGKSAQTLHFGPAAL